MNRIRQDRSEAFSVALRFIPMRFQVGSDLFCGDPIFAGIFVPAWNNELNSQTGRSYRSTAHCAYPYHCRDKRTTVVLPKVTRPNVIIHELGHVVHWHLVEKLGGVRTAYRDLPQLDVVSKYAQTNWWELWAEAFEVWCAWRHRPHVVDARRDHWPWGWSTHNAQVFEHLM